MLETRAQASYEQALRRGLRLGCLNLARLLDRGAENARSRRQSLQKFERLVESDHGPACLLLARWLQAGQRVDPDPARGPPYYSEPASWAKPRAASTPLDSAYPRATKSASTKTGPVSGRSSRTMRIPSRAGSSPDSRLSKRSQRLPLTAGCRLSRAQRPAPPA